MDPTARSGTVALTPPSSAQDRSTPPRLEEFTYDDATPRAFLFMTVVWGIVGMLVGLLAALELAAPIHNLGLPYTSFGRIRPLHTNAVIFAFAGNAVFAAIYDFSEDCRHLIRGATSNIDPVVAEDWLLPNG